MAARVSRMLDEGHDLLRTARDIEERLAPAVAGEFQVDGLSVMTDNVIQARGPVELWGLPEDSRVVFELRQVRMPADRSPWQRLAWLDAQSSLWTELGHALGEESVARGANRMADDLAGVAWWLLGQLREGGLSVPEDYPATVRAIVNRVAPVEGVGQEIEVSER